MDFTAAAFGFLVCLALIGIFAVAWLVFRSVSQRDELRSHKDATARAIDALKHDVGELDANFSAHLAVDPSYQQVMGRSEETRIPP
jgi:hypothetical protein